MHAKDIIARVMEQVKKLQIPGGGGGASFSKRHEHLIDVTTSQHHVKYTDAEAILAVEGEATLDLTGLVTIGKLGERANLNALVLGAVDQEGGNIVVYQDAAGNKAFVVDTDALDTGGIVVSILDPADDDLSVNNAYSLVIYGHDGYALQLGDAATEGGDLVVFKDAANNRAFEVDADEGGIAVNSSVVSTTKVGVTLENDDVYGISMSGVGVNAFEGTGATYGVYARRDVSGTGSTTVATRGYGLYFAGNNYRDNDGVTFSTYGLFAQTLDYGNWLEAVGPASTRNLYGAYLYAYATSSCDDDTSLDNTNNMYGVYAYARTRVGANKAAGTLTVNSYAVYAWGRYNPVVAAGNMTFNGYAGYFYVNTNPAGAGVANFVGTSYAVYAEAVGTAEGTSICYGVYASATGADVNWSGYFINATFGIGVDGSLANMTALQLGSPTQEGGDIIVYQDGAGTITFQVDADLPAVQLPYWTGDYGVAWAGLALPAAPNGSLHVVYNSNGAVLATRLYVRSNGAWVTNWP